MAHILIICTANICRSPVAEAFLHDRLHQAGLTQWRVGSAGTWAQRGRGAAAYSIEVLREQTGIDLSAHRSRRIEEELMSEASLILCMESHHAEALRAEFPHHAPKVFMLSQMVDDRRFDIDDPYGGPKWGYEQMVEQVMELIERGLPRIVELA